MFCVSIYLFVYSSELWRGKLFNNMYVFSDQQGIAIKQLMKQQPVLQKMKKKDKFTSSSVTTQLI